METYAVHGTIVNAQTNQPIGRAEVILNQEYAVLTDSEGRFEFDQIPPGDFQVSVQKPGYISFGNLTSVNFGRRFASRPRSARHIRIGPNMPELTFPLVPCGSIRGQVSLSTSDPPDGIRVSAYEKLLRNGLPHWEMAGSTSTDSDGSFHLGDLAPGKYMLFTDPSLNWFPAALRGAVNWGYPTAYYPGVTDSASAGVLNVLAGQTVEADFALPRQAFYPITVQVRNLEPGGHAGFQILDTLGRPTGLPARYSAADQTIYANVPNGTWMLQALSGGPTRLFGRTTFQVAGGPVNLAITILPAPNLPVTIRREFTSTTDARSNPTQLVHLGSAVNLQLENLESFNRGGMTHIEFEPNADSFSETTQGTIGAMPGRYWVEANTQTAAYVSSITSGGVDLAANPLVITGNNSNTPIEIVLRNDLGTINGQIARQAGDASLITPSLQVGEIPQIYVYAIPLFQTAATAVPTGWASEGQFMLANLAPGSYRVIACDSEQEIDFRTPEALAAWEGKGRVVTVNPGATATVQLDVLHAELP